LYGNRSRAGDPERGLNVRRILREEVRELPVRANQVGGFFRISFDHCELLAKAVRIHMWNPEDLRHTAWRRPGGNPVEIELAQRLGDPCGPFDGFARAPIASEARR